MGRWLDDEEADDDVDVETPDRDRRESQLQFHGSNQSLEISSLRHPSLHRRASGRDSKNDYSGENLQYLLPQQRNECRQRVTTNTPRQYQQQQEELYQEDSASSSSLTDDQAFGSGGEYTWSSDDDYDDYDDNDDMDLEQPLWKPNRRRRRLYYFNTNTNTDVKQQHKTKRKPKFRSPSNNVNSTISKHNKKFKSMFLDIMNDVLCIQTKATTAKCRRPRQRYRQQQQPPQQSSVFRVAMVLFAGVWLVWSLYARFWLLETENQTLKHILQLSSKAQLLEQFPSAAEQSTLKVELQVRSFHEEDPLVVHVNVQDLPVTAWTWLHQIQLGVWKNAEMTLLEEKNILEIRSSQTITATTTTTTMAMGQLLYHEEANKRSASLFHGESFVIGLRNDDDPSSSSSLLPSEILTIHVEKNTCGTVFKDEICFAKVVNGAYFLTQVVEDWKHERKGDTKLITATIQADHRLSKTTQ